MPKYVGYTGNTLAERKHAHKNDLCKFIHTRKGECRALYEAMIEIGWENFEFDVLEYAETEEEACALEVHWIAELETLYPNGYNLTTGGKSGYKRCEATLELMSAGAKLAHHTKTDNFRYNEYSMGLPCFMRYVEIRDAFVIERHPICSWRQFSIRDYPSRDAAKAACLEFLRNLEIRGIPYIPERELPIGILRIEGGFKVCKQINKHRYNRQFTSKNKTDAEKLQEAINYIAESERIEAARQENNLP